MARGRQASAPGTACRAPTKNGGGNEAGLTEMNSRSDIAGFILAGGESSRMGRDKALLELGGVPLIVRTVRLVESVVGPPTVIGDAAAIRALGLRTIGDDWPSAGPLGG